MALQSTLKTRVSTKPLVSYPEDVTSEKSDHYVRFDVNVPSASEVTFGSTKAYATEPKGGSTQFSTVSVPRAPTKKVDQSIVLYMPANLEVSHKANYGEPEIGLIAASALGALKGFGGAGFNIGSILEKGKAEINNAGLGMLEGIGVSGVKAAVQIQQGKITNNRTEMAFESIDRRSYSFTFKMLPKSSSEAAAIEEIVNTFRFHSMPEFAGADGTGRTMIVPSTFNITYRPNIHLHHIGECALESVNVKYGGERPQFFVDHQPVETEMTLQFKELDLVTKEKIAEGF